MLILSRRRGERIRIGQDIEVVVTDVGRGQVKLGVLAPSGVRVLREDTKRSRRRSFGPTARPALDLALGQALRAGQRR